MVWILSSIETAGSKRLASIFQNAASVENLAAAAVNLILQLSARIPNLNAA